ncbi:NADH:flavin oxidoreductase [Tessaracoccus sp. OS52]|uniref:NADH:flavin oxidoreductase n=1 Tax=Tessaracoccus sp. OS52 TaxID=2886691 RepID=UPI001D11971C|nr:NADH:flavin oxidoreductase [Tessaracoccus sp. OS52]
MTQLSEPLDFSRGPSWRNRLALAPLTNTQSNPDGSLSQLEIDWLLARARHGFGMVMTAAAYVAPAGKAWQGQLGVSSDAHLAGLEALTTGLREAGAASIVQLHHGGLRANPVASGEPLVAPWDDEATGARALTTDEVWAVIEDFTAAAVRAERAGFDGVQLHGAHGYLLCQFLSRSNTRDDGWGGDLDGRARVLRETIAAIRRATGTDFHVGLRLSAERFELATTEMVQLAAELMAEGTLDHLDMSLWDVSVRPEGADDDAPTLMSRFVALPRGTTRLGVAGKIASGPSAVAAVAAGADFVDIGRTAVADHRIAERILADADHPGPSFPVTRQDLRDNHVGEPFIEYFAKGWPQLVAD